MILEIPSVSEGAITVVRIFCFSDILCVWTYIAQARIDAVKEDFGDKVARSSAPVALIFEKLSGMPLVIMTAIATVATLNGVIVHVIMIARVIYGLA